MKAFVCDAFGEGEVREIPDPIPEAGEVVVQVDRVQLSLTECWLYRGEEVTGHEAVRDRIRTGDGRVLGHEFCGTVVETTDDADLTEDDRVFAPGPVRCGDCAYCVRGHKELCADPQIIGIHRPGALAEFVDLPASVLWKLPDEVSDPAGAAMQPLASAAIDVHDADVSTGDVVVVVGAGVVGSHCGRLSLLAGADSVYAVDIDPEMVAVADDHGMIGVNARETDSVAAVHEATDGIGADVVFEAVGGQQEHLNEGDGPMAQAFDMVRRGGAVVQVGIVPGEVTMRPLPLGHAGVSWINGRDIGGAVDLGPNSDTAERAVGLVASGRHSLNEFVTHELDGLGEVEKAVEMTTNRDDYAARGPTQLLL